MAAGSAQLGDLFLGDAQLGGLSVTGGANSTGTIAAQIGAWTASAMGTTGNEDVDIFATPDAWTSSVAASTLASIATINGQIGKWTANVTAQADTNHSAATINALIGGWTVQVTATTPSRGVGRPGDKKVQRRKVKIDNQWVDLTDEEWADYLNKEEEAEPVTEGATEAPRARVSPPDTSGLLAPAELAPDAPLPFQAPQIDHSLAIRFAQQLEHRNRVQQDDQDVLALVHGMPEEHEPSSALAWEPDMTPKDMETLKQHMDSHAQNLANVMGQHLQALHHVLSTPKKIVRDAKGKAVGVQLDETTQ